MSTKHFLKRGHTAIGFLAGPKTSYGGLRRTVGYHSALEEYDLDYRPEMVCHCTPTVEGGHEAAIQLIEENPEISALFCFNDLVALGALQGCQRLGRTVPDDLAIIGYDDIPMASWVTPPLTTCRVDFEEMGSLAVRQLVNKINACSEDCENKVVKPELILRASAP
jgi:LacI family transcriptional regulator